MRTTTLRSDLGSDPRQVSYARRMLAEYLADWGVTGEQREVAVLLTSELVTNAILHGTPPLRLVAVSVGSGVRVEVHDGGDAAPLVRDTELDSVGGRGLRLVEALSARWGTTGADPGTVVWFEVDTRP